MARFIVDFGSGRGGVNGNNIRLYFFFFVRVLYVASYEVYVLNKKCIHWTHMDDVRCGPYIRCVAMQTINSLVSEMKVTGCLWVPFAWLDVENRSIIF